MTYLESLKEKLDRPELCEEEKDTIFEQIEQVAKIAKQYADRINLVEGKATENIALNHHGKIPFEIIITKAYEDEQETEKPQIAQISQIEENSGQD
jgi:hypothetical protein